MKNQYIIVSHNDKNVLAKVLATKENKLKIQINGNTSESFIIHDGEIIANLGFNPKEGTVYGVKVEPLVESIDSDFWGTCRIFRFLQDGERKDLFSSMKEVRKEWVKRKLPSMKFDVHIKPPVGTKAGCYHYKPKDLDVIDVHQIMGDSTIMHYIFAHEMGHGLWYRHMNSKVLYRWISLYYSSLRVTELDKKDLDELYEKVVADQNFSSMLKDEEHKLATRAILRSIFHVHALNKRHLELSLSLGQDIYKFWPTKLEVSEKDILLTKYSTKSPEEFFAEAFSYHFVGKKIPNSVNKLLQTTLVNFIH